MDRAVGIMLLFGFFKDVGMHARVTFIQKEIIALVCGDVKMFSIVEHTLGWLH